MADVLILGGTRDIGHFAALELLEAGHRVAVLNRGHTTDDLPREIDRIRADRSHPGDMQRALGGRAFDLVFDTTTYDGPDAMQAVETFAGRAGRYVFVSTGQVYLVRAGVERPFREEDYDGPLVAEPEPGTADHDSWRYGVEKRDAEAVFGSAWAKDEFPVTTLRLPIVASERDPGGRVQAYVARLLDGGPLLVPADAGLPVRHVYVRDIARLLALLVGRQDGLGGAYNISFGSSLGLDEFIDLLRSIVGESPASGQLQSRVRTVPRSVLEARALLPGCSPFSSPWMSELDDQHGAQVFGPLGFACTAPPTYVRAIVSDYLSRWRPAGIQPSGYDQRERELSFVAELRGS